jgi:hypothetical protein
LPPIDVIERADGYYVLDGRHRVSVARALGHDAIDAWSSPASAGQRRLARRRHASQTDGADAHFHTGDRGRPYVCGDRHCRSPRLDVMAGR